MKQWSRVMGRLMPDRAAIQTIFQGPSARNPRLTAAAQASCTLGGAVEFSTLSFGRDGQVRIDNRGCPATSVPHTFGDRLLPNGTRVPFTIPAGQVLVITSYDWVIEGSTQINGTVWTTVALFDGTGNVSALSSGAAADSIGRAAGNTAVPNGVVVKPGTAMCFNFVGGSRPFLLRAHTWILGR